MNDFIKKVNICFKYCFVSTLPVLSGYTVIGISFGIVMVNKGFNLLYIFLMSAGIYAGSMQFVTIDMITQNVSILAAILMTVFVNIRHLFYGISMLTKYKKIKFFKNYCIFALTDETFSLVCEDVPKEFDENAYYFTISILDHLYWIIGSLIGGILGRFIPQDIKGLDFSMTALFVVIVISQWEKQKNHIATIIGFVVSFVCLFIFGTKLFILPSMIIILILLLLSNFLNIGNSY